MAADITIKNGLDLPMEGAAGTGTATIASAASVSVYPSEYTGVKFKLIVKEGDRVKRGSELGFNKKYEAFKLRAPAAGTIKSIVLGDRRSLQEIIIDVEGDETESFATFTPESALSADREAMLAHLNHTGVMGLLRQRPFNKLADSSVAPKSIFVNAMSTAPFRPDAHFLVQGKENAFQTGLNALTRLSDGPVYLCAAAEKKSADDAITKAQNVNVSYFSGPHPSGNTSTHIHYLDPILPGDTVWTLRVSDVIRMGEVLTSGLVPNTQTVFLAGNGVKEECRGYITAPAGSSLAAILDGRLEEGEQRLIRGDVLAGDTTSQEGNLHFYDQGFVVLPEDRERHLMGWYAPTTTQWSSHRVVPSNWLKGKTFTMGTSSRGSHRAMVFTGILDKYTPLDLMVDYMIRACIGKDTDEAIELGILETDPEDFALCTVVCPSKTDYGQIIADGLALIEKEGI